MVGTMRTEARQLQFQKKLSEELARIQMRNSSFSLRAFSKRLGLSPSVVSEFLNGKRNLSKNMMEKIMDRLEIAPTEREVWIEPQVVSELNVATSKRKLLSTEQFHLISEGIHFSILSLLETDEAPFTIETISSRLGFAKTKVEKAIERLMEFEMVEKLETGHFRFTGVNFSSSDGVSSLGVRKSHRETLDWAQESLDVDPVELRDFTALTLAVDPELLPEIKTRIRDFMAELSKLADSKPKKEVYKIAMQVFPLSVPANKNEE